MCKTVNSMGRGVGVEVGVDVGVGVEVLVGMEVGVGVGVDMIALQPDKANPTNMKKPIRNKSLFLDNAIPPNLETRLSRSQFAPAGLHHPAVEQRIWQFITNFCHLLRLVLL